MKTVTEKSSHHQTASHKRAKDDAPSLLDRRDVLLSQSSVDSSPLVVAQRMQIESAFGNAIQRQPLEEEEEEPLQGKFATIQRQPLEEEEEPLQGKFAPGMTTVLQKKPSPNRTGLPDELKAGVEGLSGLSLEDVRVHYNSSKPAELQALAYTQGTDIHVASGQERHVPHEAWHAVQQMQGRVQPTTQVAEMAVNDSPSLENEADLMGNKALQMVKFNIGKEKVNAWAQGAIIQRAARDLKCTATAFYGNKGLTAVGYNGQKQDVEGRIGQYGGGAGIAVFEGKASKYDNKTMYECAEANAMANVLQKHNPKMQRLPRRIEISDATWTVVRGTHQVNDVEPRCDNCNQWVPNKLVLDWEDKAAEINKSKKKLKELIGKWQ